MTTADLARIFGLGLAAAVLSYVASRSADLAVAVDRDGTADALNLVGTAWAIAALAAVAFAFTVYAVRLSGGER